MPNNLHSDTVRRNVWFTNFQLFRQIYLKKTSRISPEPSFN